MIKFLRKLKSLFSLEDRITAALQLAFAQRDKRIAECREEDFSKLNRKFTEAMQQAPKIKAELVQRISRLEVLLADELEKAEERLKRKRDDK